MNHNYYLKVYLAFRESVMDDPVTNGVWFQPPVILQHFLSALHSEPG